MVMKLISRLYRWQVYLCSLHAASGLHAVVLPSNSVLCLLNGQPAASCSIRYGTDSTYRVLPNTDSAVTGGVITLTSTLTGDMTYYIVFTTTGSMTMESRGSFTTCTTQDLMALNTLVQPQSSCGKPSGNIRLACYSGVTPGSTVTYRHAPGIQEASPPGDVSLMEIGVEPHPTVVSCHLQLYVI